MPLKCLLNEHDHAKILVGIIPSWCDLNEKSRKMNINRVIRKLVAVHLNTNLLELYNLFRCFHTSQGFHINISGKLEVSKRTAAEMEKWNEALLTQDDSSTSH